MNLYKSRQLYNLFTKISLVFKPLKTEAVFESNTKYSPDLNFVNADIVKKFIKEYKGSFGGEKSFLDIGGRRGELKKLAKSFKYQILEIDSEVNGPDVIIGDICDSPNLKNEQFDIVFSNNVFEHLKEPWNAAEECVRIVRKGGLIIHIVPFGARYHPVPIDFYRYSHDGMKYLFERTNEVETLLAAYDISKRRQNKIGGKVKGDLDLCPVDKYGGWIENWKTIYVGRKIN